MGPSVTGAAATIAVIEALCAGEPGDAVIAARGISLRGSAAAESRIRAELRWIVPVVANPQAHDASLWMELVSPDGYRREAALRHLDQPAPGQFLLAVLLRRLNDWVAPVREVATEAVRACVVRTGPMLVVRVCLYLLVESRAWERDQRGCDVIHECLAAEHLRPDVLEQLAGVSARPVTLQTLLKGDAFDWMLEPLASGAIVPGIRAAAVLALTRGEVRTMAGREKVWVDRRYNQFKWKPLQESRKITCAVASDANLRAFARDRSAVVRRALLDGLDGRAAPVTREIATMLIDDPWPSIRERAAFLLRD